MSVLTGNKDVDFDILLRLDDISLASLCSTNREARELCKREQFWKNRIVSVYGSEALKGKPERETFRDYYTSGKVKTYTICKTIEGVQHMSQLVVDDFYHPVNGLINANYTRDLQSLVYLLLKITYTRMESFDPRDLEEEERLKRAINQAVERVPEYRQSSFNLDTYYMTPGEKDEFIKLIDIKIGRPQILRSASRNRPDMIKAFSNPEVQFRLLAHIHDGFRKYKIPLDIFWSELCTIPYVLDFKF